MHIYVYKYKDKSMHAFACIHVRVHVHTKISYLSNSKALLEYSVVRGVLRAQAPGDKKHLNTTTIRQQCL